MNTHSSFNKDLLVALAGLAILVAIPFFSPGRVALDFVIRLAAFGLFATSLNILVGYGGMVSFGHAMFFGGGAYAFGLLMQKGGASIPVAILGAILFCALLGLVIGAICVRLKEIYFSFLTLAFQMLIHSIIITWTSLTGGDQGLMGGIPRVWGSLNLADVQTLYWFSCVLGVVCLFLMVRDNADRAQFLGINVWRVRLYAFILASCFAGIGGVIMALFVSGAYPEFSYWTMSGEAVFMIMMGGLHAFIGPVVGAGLLMVFNDIITRTTEYHGLALGIIVLFFALGLKRGMTDFVVQIYQSLSRKGARS
jgi:branched-chain amino acid transport system permease protein